MAKRWCFFQLLTEEEIDRWNEKLSDYIATASHSKRTERLLPWLLRLRDFGEEAALGQYVVIKKPSYAIAKMVGALPKRLMNVSFEALPEGIPSGLYEGSREIIPGVSEGTEILLTMGRKGKPRQRIELSRADVEAAIRHLEEEQNE